MTHFLLWGVISPQKCKLWIESVTVISMLPYIIVQKLKCCSMPFSLCTMLWTTHFFPLSASVIALPFKDISDAGWNGWADRAPFNCLLLGPLHLTTSSHHESPLAIKMSCSLSLSFFLWRSCSIPQLFIFLVCQTRRRNDSHRICDQPSVSPLTVACVVVIINCNVESIP